MIRIGRTIPPAAAPIYLRDILNGLKGFIRGKKEINRFNSELRHYFGVKHVFLVSSGKAALTLILKAVHDLNPDRDEVLVPAFCCYSVPSAIVRAGLKVKLCDVHPDTLDYDYDQFKELVAQSSKLKEREAESNPTNPINFQPVKFPSGRNKVNFTGPINSTNSTNRLLSVIPVHLFGLVSDVERVQEIVNDPEIAIIEDAAQVLGATCNDKKLGTQGDVGFFSLGRGKALSTIEGGIIITNRDDIGENLRNQLEKIPAYNILERVELIFNAVLLIVFQHPLFFWFPKSLPFLRVGDTFYDPEFRVRKMSGFQAGLARNWEGKLEVFKNNRRGNSKQLASISEFNSIQRYCSKNGHVPDMIRFPVRIEEAGKWQKSLKLSEKYGLGIMPTYPDSIDGIPELKAALKGQSCPIAKKLSHQLVTFPIHPYVLPKDIKKIAKLFSKEIKLSPIYD